MEEQENIGYVKPSLPQSAINFAAGRWSVIFPLTTPFRNPFDTYWRMKRLKVFVEVQSTYTMAEDESRLTVNTKRVWKEWVLKLSSSSRNEKH